MNENTSPNMTLTKAVIGAFLPLAILILMTVLGASLNVALLVTVFAVYVLGLILGFKPKALDDALIDGVSQFIGATIVMMLVGVLIALWMASGTVPSMIYFGLKAISPVIFLPLAFLLSAVTAVATGTSWGTAGTIGIALIGMSSSLGIPVAITAGAIISGAIFGDKMSPLSDCCLLASAASNTNVFDLITCMFYTTVPSAVIALVAFAVIGFGYQGTLDYTAINVLLDGMKGNFNISILELLPPVLVIIMSIKRFSTYTVFGTGIIFSAVWAIFRQGIDLTSLMGYVASGYVADTGIESLDSLLSRGGIASMMEMVGVVILAGILCGLLKEMNVFNILVNCMGQKFQSPRPLVCITVITTFVVALATANQYTPMALSAIAFQEAFDKADLHPSVLGRTIEDVGVVMPAIIPWGLAAIFFASTLGVPALDFAPYAFFCWLCPVVALVNGALGIGLLHKKDRVGYHPFRRRTS